MMLVKHCPQLCPDGEALCEADERGDMAWRPLTKKEAKVYEEYVRDWHNIFFVRNKPTFELAQEKDEETGEPLYEINVRVLVEKERKEYWENMAKFFGCPLSYFIDQCLWYGEERARDMRRYCEAKMKRTGKDCRFYF